MVMAKRMAFQKTCSQKVTDSHALNSNNSKFLIAYLWDYPVNQLNPVNLFVLAFHYSFIDVGSNLCQKYDRGYQQWGSCECIFDFETNW